MPLGLLIWVAFLSPTFSRHHSLRWRNWKSATLSARHGICFGARSRTARFSRSPFPRFQLSSALFTRWVCLRSKTKLRYVLDALAFLPHAVPSIVFAVSGLLLSLFVFAKSCRSYGTLTLLLAVHVIHRLSFGTRVTNSAIIAISTELEEAAEVCGAERRDVISTFCCR